MFVMDNFIWRNFLPSNINTILENEDVCLDDILNEADVAQECNSGNEKLIDYLLSNNNLEDIVDVMLAQPSLDLEEKMRYKASNAACGVLSCDNHQIKNSIFTNRRILDKLLNYLDIHDVVNPLQASFLCKCILSLASFKSYELVEYFLERGKVIQDIIKHITTSAISDMFLQLTTTFIDNICCKSVNEEIQDKNIWFKLLNEECLLSTLITLITTSRDSEVNYSSSQLLCDILYSLRTLDKSSKDACQSILQLQSDIESKETADKLLASIFDENNWEGGRIPESVLISCIMVLLNLLDDQQIQDYDDENRNRIKGQIFESIILKLDCFHGYLINPPQQHYVPMQSSCGEMEIPLGKTRLQISRLLSTLLSSGPPESLFEKLGQLDTINVLVNLFFKYQWNNFLHTEVERCLSIVLNLPFTHHLFQKVIIESSIIEKISNCFEKYRTIEKSSMRPGYMGQLTIIANSINSKIFQIPERFKTIFPALRDRWVQCTQEYLREINNQNNTPLFDNAFSPRSNTSSPINIETPIIPAQDQEGFAKYQTQIMTEPFTENFGINDLDFEGILPFEVCNKKFQSITFEIDVPTEFPPSFTFLEQACQGDIRIFDSKIKTPFDVTIYKNDESTDEDDDDDGGDDDNELSSTEAKQIIPSNEFLIENLQVSPVFLVSENDNNSFHHDDNSLDDSHDDDGGGDDHKTDDYDSIIVKMPTEVSYDDSCNLEEDTVNVYRTDLVENDGIELNINNGFKEQIEETPYLNGLVLDTSKLALFELTTNEENIDNNNKDINSVNIFVNGTDNIQSSFNQLESTNQKTNAYELSLDDITPTIQDDYTSL